MTRSLPLDKIAMMLTGTGNTADENALTALKLCSAAQRTMEAQLGSDMDRESKEFLIAAAASARRPLQILGLIPSTSAPRRPHPSVSAVVHGTRSAVLEHATRAEARISECRECWRWCTVHTRAGRGSPIAPDCGSRAAAQRHHRTGEALCLVCQTWSDERRRRSSIPPGSRCGMFPEGQRTHRDLGEKVCDRCRRRLAPSADLELREEEGHAPP